MSITTKIIRSVAYDMQLCPICVSTGRLYYNEQDNSVQTVCTKCGALGTSIICQEACTICTITTCTAHGNKHLLGPPHYPEMHPMAKLSCKLIRERYLLDAATEAVQAWNNLVHEIKRRKRK